MICINPSKRMVKAIKLSVMIYALKYENISFSTAAIFQFLSVCNPVEYGFSYWFTRAWHIDFSLELRWICFRQVSMLFWKWLVFPLPHLTFSYLSIGIKQKIKRFSLLLQANILEIWNNITQWKQMQEVYLDLLRNLSHVTKYCGKVLINMFWAGVRPQ